MDYLLILYWIIKSLHNLGSNPCSICVVQKYFPQSICCPFFLLMLLLLCRSFSFSCHSIYWSLLLKLKLSVWYPEKHIMGHGQHQGAPLTCPFPGGFRPHFKSPFHSQPVLCCVKGWISCFPLWIPFSQHYLLSAYLILTSPLAVFAQH